MQFERIPLVEVVASLRWIPTLPTLPGQISLQTSPDQPFPIFASPPLEDFLSGFAKETATLGWTSSERMVPQGFPFLSNQPALRVRSLDSESSNMIYQVGPGVFSAHAVSPYKDWETFRPFTKNGLDALLKTRPTQEQNSQFMSVELRYFNVFTSALLDDISTFDFFTDVMGFKLELPLILREQVNPQEKVEPQFAVRLLLKSGLEMKLNIAGKSTMGDKTGILMDTRVSSIENVAADTDSVCDIWEKAHSAIESTFVALTSKLHSTMKLMG